MVSKVFRVEVEPVTEWITTDGIEGKLKRMAGAVGLRVLSVVPMDETGDQAASVQDVFSRIDSETDTRIEDLKNGRAVKG